MGAALLSCALLSGTARAQDVAPYDDQDSDVWKVAYYFVYPVGKIAEFAVFRPLATLSKLTQPDPELINRRDPKPAHSCLAFRPTRSCSAGD
jgi:hypothetical protein